MHLFFMWCPKYTDKDPIQDEIEKPRLWKLKPQEKEALSIHQVSLDVASFVHDIVYMTCT